MRPLKIVLDPTILVGASAKTVRGVAQCLDMIGRGTIYISSELWKDTKMLVAGADKVVRVAKTYNPQKVMKLIDAIEKSPSVQKVDDIKKQVEYPQNAKEEKLLNLALQKRTPFVVNRKNDRIFTLIEIERKNGKVVLKKYPNTFEGIMSMIEGMHEEKQRQNKMQSQSQSL